MSEITRGIENWPAADSRKHHRFSPSTLQNREACPCYESRDTVHIRAIAGTLAHGVVETRKDNNLLSDEDALAAAGCLDFVDRRKAMMDEARAAYLAVHSGTREVPEVQELKEIYLPIDDCATEDGCESTTAGYVDHALIDHTQTYAELIDWKFGMWPVETAENNLQGISYTLGLFRKFQRLQKIRFFFFQPLLGTQSDFIFYRDQIPALYLRVQTVVARARRSAKMMETGDFSTAIPMIPACNFCANIGSCEKVAAFMCKVGHKFYPVEIPENITPSMVLEKTETTLALRLAQVVKVWADAFRSQVTDRAIRGDAPVPEGFYIQTQSRRKLVDKEKFKTVALRYLTEAEYLDALDVVFGDIEGLISKNAPRGNKKLTVEQFQHDLAAAGATTKGDPFSFLRAKATKE